MGNRRRRRRRHLEANASKSTQVPHNWRPMPSSQHRSRIIGIEVQLCGVYVDLEALASNYAGPCVDLEALASNYAGPCVDLEALASK